MQRGVALSCLALFVSVLAGRSDEPSVVVTNLPPVVVIAPAIRDAGWQLPGDSAAAATEALPRVTISSQGGAGAQNDLSIQGSSFSGAGLSVAGLALLNPQTEHFNSELPIPASVLTVPLTLTGMDQAREGAGHLVGSVSFDIAPIESHMAVEAGVGEHSRNWQSAVVQTPVTGEPGKTAVGVGGFAGREVADSLDWPDNDLERTYVGGQVQAEGRDGRFDLIAARQEKEFGARGYYGVTPAWDASEKLDDTLILGTWHTGPADDPRLRLSASWREVEDQYKLFWTLPGVYQNNHTSQVANAAADGVVPLSKGERYDAWWRVAYDHEDLDSNALGHHDRMRTAATLIPRLTAGDVRVEAGMRAEALSDDSPAWLPQTRVSWNVAPCQALYASYAASVREPSYTELNYDSPGSLGNQGLERQEDHALEAGYKGTPVDKVTLYAAAFARRSRNTVDWIRETEASTRWVATDLGTVDTLGSEVEVTWAATHVLDLQGGYVWLEKDADLPLYASRYVMDYPEQMLRAAAVWSVTERTAISAEQGVRRQTDSPMREGGQTAYPARLSLRHAPRWWRGAELAVALDNAWDDDFQYLAGQPSSDQRASASLRLSW